MKKLIILVIALLFLMGCQQEKSDKLTVAVSIVPEETFVKKVAGDLVHVIVLIPPGNSPTNYQPTPQERAKFNDSKVYFHIDVAAEEHILQSASKDIKLVDLADPVDVMYPARFFDAQEEHDGHSHDGRDPHIWLSPRRVIVMIETIRDELVLLDPDNKSVYESNASDYIKELSALDNELIAIFESLSNKAFIMYHPSFGYFADDYKLDMHAIEAEGKKATIKELEYIIELAKSEQIKYVFYQEEFDAQQAEIVAKEIGGETINVAPLSGDYINNLKSIAEKMKNILD